MLSIIAQPVRHLLQIFKSHDTPTQMAVGFTLGALMGLLPVGNLIAIAIGVLIFSLNVNRAAGCLGAFIFMWLAPLVDPIAQTVGLKILSLDAIQGSYALLYDLPLGPWLEFNNSVVMGSLILGVYFSYPVFWLSYAAVSRVQSWIFKRRHQRELRQMVDEMKIGAKWGVAA